MAEYRIITLSEEVLTTKDITSNDTNEKVLADHILSLIADQDADDLELPVGYVDMLKSGVCGFYERIEGTGVVHLQENIISWSEATLIITRIR